MPTDSEDSADETNGPIRTVPVDADPAHFPKALAARIGDRSVWIANSGGVEPTHLVAMELNPEFVVSVNQTATEATTDHHPLKDGYVNDQDEFREAVEATRQRLQQSGSVIVNCAAGISRSTTVSATAIAAEEDLDFDAVVEEIKETRPRARPHPKLQLNALAYLANTEDRSDARAQFEELAADTRIRNTGGGAVEDLLSSDTAK
jgi:Predicted protein-tyrosine phosphatase